MHSVIYKSNAEAKKYMKKKINQRKFSERSHFVELRMHRGSFEVLRLVLIQLERPGRKRRQKEVEATTGLKKMWPILLSQS